MFQCFATKNIWPGIFTFSLTLFQFVVKRFETFQIRTWSFMALFQLVSADPLYNLHVSMFRNKKHMAWNFHLFSSLVSICCETFRNVSKFGLSHFLASFNLFQCFIETNGWPGIFQHCCTLFRNIATIVFETFRNKLQQRHSVNLVKLSKYFGLYNLYVSMFQCFTETNGWPGISAGFLCNI